MVTDTSNQPDTDDSTTDVVRMDGREVQIEDGELRRTLSVVLDDPVINKHFGTKDGKLSRPQRGLASAVVATLQDHFIREIERIHDKNTRLIVRLATFRSAALELYRVPIFAGPQERTSNGKRLVDEIFTWGNLIAFVGIGVAALALYVTSATASYKDQLGAERDRTRIQSERILSLEQENDSLNQALRDVELDNVRKETTIQAQKQQLEQDQNNRMTPEQIEALVSQKVKDATAAQTSKNSYKSLYETARAKLTTAENRVDQLNTKVANLQEQIRKLREENSALAATKVPAQ